MFDEAGVKFHVVWTAKMVIASHHLYLLME